MRQDHVFSVTLTELIVILLFLFLLVTAWKMRKLETAMASANDVAAVAQAENQSLRDAAAGRKKLPPEFFKLVRAAAARGQTVEQVLDERETLEVEADACAEAKERLSNENEQLRSDLESSDPGALGDENRELERELGDLQGQYANLKRRIGKGGFDLPPCWADSEGRIQFLYSVVIHEDGIGVEPAWPAERADDAEALPNVAGAISDRASIGSFLSQTRAIFDWSAARECRHYVHIYDEAVSKSAYKEQRLAVESHFYKLEHR